MNHRKVLTALVAVATALGLAAGTAGANTPQAGGGSTRGVTDTEITVGGIGQAAFYAPGVEVGAEARFKVENDKGGVNGREINFLGFRDDGGDNAQNIDEARKLVQEDEIFAAVPVITPALGGADVFQQNKTPFFGWGISAPFCGNPFGFGFSGCLTPPDPTTASSAWGEMMSTALGGGKGKTAAVIAEDNDSGKTGAAVIGASAKAGGFKVVYQENPVPPPPAPTPDVTPYANDIMTSDGGNPPDVVFVVTSFSNVGVIGGKLQELGYQGALTNAVGYDPSFVGPYKGTSVFIQFNAFESAAEGNTNMQQIIDNIHAVQPDITLTQPVLSGYLSADLFVRVLKKAGKDLTAEKFLQVANAFKYSYKDVTGTVKFPKAHTHGSQCGSLVESDGTNYTINVPYACYTEVKL